MAEYTPARVYIEKIRCSECEKPMELFKVGRDNRGQRLFFYMCEDNHIAETLEQYPHIAFFDENMNEIKMDF